MNLWRSLEGMVEVELTSADPPCAVSFLTDHGIQLQDTTLTGDLTLGFQIRRSQFRQLAALAARRGERLRIIRRRGLYWAGKGLLHRPVLLCMAFLLVGLTAFLPSRVLLIRVEGNEAVPTRRILEAAEDCGIRFWASRREIRSEQMKNRLLGEIPELQWAGVNTAGCVATISVRERATQTTQVRTPGVCNVVAAREGLITEVTVLQGNGLCKVGQVVQAGELLVSGYTDCGISVQATRAEAEIYAMTKRDFSAYMPSEWVKKGSVTHSEKKYSLLVGKKRINFSKNSGIPSATCGKMTAEYPLILPGGFPLPICLVVETVSYYEPEKISLPQETAQNALMAFSASYLEQTMVAGEILEQEQKLESLDGAYCLTGTYTCREMIARQQSGEIFETNGKTD